MRTNRFALAALLSGFALPAAWAQEAPPAPAANTQVNVQPQPAQPQQAPQPAAMPQTNNNVVVQPAVQPAPPPQPTANFTVNPEPVVRDREAVDYRVHTGLITGGALLFGGAYAASAITASVNRDLCNDRNRDATFGCNTDNYALYIPIAGPFIQMGQVEGSGRNTARALLAVDGAIQIAGAAMTVWGIALSATPHPATTTTTRPLTLKESTHFVPYASASGAGMAAIGRF